MSPAYDSFKQGFTDDALVSLGTQLDSIANLPTNRLTFDGFYLYYKPYTVPTDVMTFFQDSLDVSLHPDTPIIQVDYQGTPLEHRLFATTMFIMALAGLAHCLRKWRAARYAESLNQ